MTKVHFAVALSFGAASSFLTLGKKKNRKGKATSGATFLCGSEAVFHFPFGYRLSYCTTTLLVDRLPLETTSIK